ncbi:App1 family protein [Nocardioides nanhaiensis]|uniref:DUF2183 domain-containing protein n=1 Tax=Nocardioides nanhaiensis TaxID=1476871 RepID=A0ABP8WY87_9ACTN
MASEPGSERPHVARVVEDGWNLGLAVVLTRVGWGHRVVGHVGYGGAGFVRVLARVLRAAPGSEPSSDGALLQRRGWRNFVTAEALATPVRVEVGGQVHEALTDRSGNLDVRLPNPGLEPGWHHARVSVPGGGVQATAESPLLVVGEETRLGIVSDIDDTVLTTLLPRPLLAAYHTFVAREEARRPVPGMAELYAGIVAGTGDGSAQVPTVYVSTGAWNTAATLRRFLAREGLPSGPMLLTDWGPTNTGWFRSGRDHKAECLRTLARDLPHVAWVLVGDDGQHDPTIYADFARSHPGNVRAIALRELSMSQQVLASGSPLPREEAGEEAGVPEIPEVRGADGHELAARLLPLLAGA